jgi:predicted ester cyclase
VFAHMEFPKILFGVILMAVMGSAAVALSSMNQQQALAQQNQTSEEQNKKLILDILKLRYHVDEEIGHLLADDAIIHIDDKPVDRQLLRNQSKEFMTAFPDMKKAAEVIVAEDDLIGVLWTFNGTHQGEYLGIPASGKPVTLRMVEFMRISNGTIMEYWPVPDATDLYLDIGYLVHRNETNATTTTQ